MWHRVAAAAAELLEQDVCVDMTVCLVVLERDAQQGLLPCAGTHALHRCNRKPGCPLCHNPINMVMTVLEKEWTLLSISYVYTNMPDWNSQWDASTEPLYPAPRPSIDASQGELYSLTQCFLYHRKRAWFIGNEWRHATLFIWKVTI